MQRVFTILALTVDLPHFPFLENAPLDVIQFYRKNLVLSVDVLHWVLHKISAVC